ncbi:hypothetical protein J6590_082471 [Homalodisca vitripennis]|nr:hypothetical protein J6590_082471 [Homalodisca vitripennis]
MQSGEYRAQNTPNVLVEKWVDRRDVIMLSSGHTNQIYEFGKINHSRPVNTAQEHLTKPPKRRRYNPVAQEALSVMKNLGDKIKPRDEIDAFGEYVAGQLRKCTDLRQMAVTKHRINQALFDLEIANLPSNQPTPNISTPSRMSYETDESVSLLDNFLSDDTETPTYTLTNL